MKEYEKWSDALADLEKLASGLENEEQKAELNAIIDGLKALDKPAEEESGQAKQPDEDAIAKLVSEAVAKAVSEAEANIKAEQNRLFAQGFGKAAEEKPMSHSQKYAELRKTDEAEARKYLAKHKSEIYSGK